MSAQAIDPGKYYYFSIYTGYSESSCEIFYSNQCWLGVWITNNQWTRWDKCVHNWYDNPWSKAVLITGPCSNSDCTAVICT